MTADTVGGVWTYSMELCAALQAHRVSIELATMGQPLSAAQRLQVARLKNVTLHESRFRLCWMNEPWEDVAQAAEWLLHLERETGPDLVHLNDLGHGGIDWLSPVVLVAHSCVLSWWEAVRHREAPSPQWDRYRSVVQASVRAANLVVAPTAAMLNALARHHGEPRKSRIIHNGRNFPRMLMSGEEKQAVAEDVVFSAGRLWDEAKNIAALDAAASRLSWPVVVAGEQAAPGEPTARARADSDVGAFQAAGVQYLGHLPQEALESWLGRTSIYAAPARYEPFGLAIVEAARARCALVLGDIPSLREIWGGAAVYVDPDRPEQLVDVLNSLIDNPAQIEHMGGRALQRAQRYFASHMAACYMESYRSLLGLPERPPLFQVQRPGTRL